MKKAYFTLLAVLLIGVFSIWTHPQSGGTFVITKSVIAGGGGRSTAGTFTLDGSIGQAFGGVESMGGMFSLQSGFWSPPVQPTPTPANGSITGNVAYTIVTKPVPGVVLNAMGALSPTATTDQNGFYSLTNFGAGAYMVTPTKQAQQCGATNGIFSFDAAKISQYIVGLRTFSDDQIAAAMVSGLGFVSAFDASLIARRVVGICTNPTNFSGEWRFTPSGRSYANVLTGITGENYTAILMGDVDGDWNPAFGTRPAQVAMLPDAVHASIRNVVSPTGSMVEIPLTIENLKGEGVISYQFDIEYDPAIVEPAEAAVDLTGTVSDGLLSVVYNVAAPGLLKVAVYGAYPASGDGLYAKLRFSVIGEAGASSGIKIHKFRFNNVTGVATVDGRVTVASADGNVNVSVLRRFEKNGYRPKVRAVSNR